MIDAILMGLLSGVVLGLCGAVAVAWRELHRMKVNR